MTNKIKITELIQQRRVYFDGGFGSMMQKNGLTEFPPEIYNTTNADIITKIHSDYLNAGCDIITTNTFGINSLKYENYEELIVSAMQNAKAATKNYPNSYIAFDLGPCSKLLEPYGDLSFDDAVELFAKNCKIAQNQGADLIIIETMNDCLETKAAVIAAKENTDLPVFVTNVYDEKGKLMTGASPEGMCAMLEGLGVDALGANCSLGPDKMLPIIERLSKVCSLPIIANPNAGLPNVYEGKTFYDMNSDVFASFCEKIAKAGANIIGGCCGSEPDYIKKVIEKTKDIPLKPLTKKNLTVISSFTHAVNIGSKPILIGERINPTGKKKFKEALKNNDLNYILNEGISQAEKNVDVLDVNVGLPEIDEPKMLCDVIKALQSVTNLPLQIDTSDTVALEKAMRIYAGKPLVNSVNGKEESIKSIFPLVKKYGGTVIALTLDENGIPNTADERIKIAKKIIARAEEYGVSENDIVVDPLALAVSSDKNSAIITLETIKKLHENGIKTSLGVSNISFGLPRRELINSTFFANALENGLDCAIMNPFADGMMDVYYSFCALYRLDTACESYIAYATSSENAISTTQKDDKEMSLQECIIKGLVNQAQPIAKELIKTTKPLDIINLHIIPALNKIGSDFESGKAFLPQLLMSADSASNAFKVVKEKIPAKSSGEQKVILATVKGDIHDIGKNIVKVLLESYGFQVIDLGKDVAPEKVLQSVKDEKCFLVGLSALMTTTVTSMSDTIKLLNEYDENIKVIVGGAVLNQDYANMIKADYYSPDAMDTVRYAQKYYKA